MMAEYKKKLIEVALPLDAINKQSAREKTIRHGHPSTLHLWWSRKPLAACRAVLFAQLVDDPSAHPELFPTEEDQLKERERLFKIIEEIVDWDNSNIEYILDKARKEIIKSSDGNPPAILDPFCGGGSIPVEAQRLGLEAYGSDLNPVAVLITKAMIEIPARFTGKPPVNSESRSNHTHSGSWKGATGLAEDVIYYGEWMRKEAEKRIGHLYPKAILPKERGGGEATVIAWLWVRTVRCPNPACRAEMPLPSSFILSNKENKTWFEPIIDYAKKTIEFTIKTGEGTPPDPPKIGRGAKFKCLVCGQAAEEQDIKNQFRNKENGSKLIAMVAEGKRGRIYLPASLEHLDKAKSAKPNWHPIEEMNQNTTNLVSGRGFGIKNWHELFTERQLLVLTTFSDLIREVKQKIEKEARDAGMPDDETGIDDSGSGAKAYSEAVATYLSFAIDKAADYWSGICTWNSAGEKMRNTFARQAIPMTWDYAECNPFSNSTGNWMANIEWVAGVLHRIITPRPGAAKQLDATASINDHDEIVISTDPPYYDNIGYADLSDFFYVWLRKNIGDIYPGLFSTVLTPKSQELIATPYRFDGEKKKEKAKEFFEEGFRKALKLMLEKQNENYPLTLYYAFKQAEFETDESSISSFSSSTGWETMLKSVIDSGFMITGTWPIRTELINRPTSLGSNSLASSIVLCLRQRYKNAPMATKGEFVSGLKKELPEALKMLQKEYIAPVDLAQASIGPGMAVFTRYSKVLESDGSQMSVRNALRAINEELDLYLTEQEGDMDSDTRFCIAWFEQFGVEEGPFGQAETLTKAKNTSIDGMQDAGVITAKAGKVRIKKREELNKDWDPLAGKRLTVWECVQYLIKNLEESGEEGAAALVTKLGAGKSEEARALVYRLYSIAERKGWAQEALAYNTLVIAWPNIMAIVEKPQEKTEELKLE